MHAHAARKVTKELVILRFWRDDANAECGIGITFFHHTDEFDHIFRHKKRDEEKAVTS